MTAAIIFLASLSGLSTLGLIAAAVTSKRSINWGSETYEGDWTTGLSAENGENLFLPPSNAAAE